jgi:hypothetical protein
VTIVEIARLFLFVREREGAPNEGLRVEGIQKWSGGRAGDSWCCYMLCLWLDLYWQGVWPDGWKRTGVCQEVYDLAKANKLIVELPHIGDICLVVNDADHAHHIRLVTDVRAEGTLQIAGNTSADGMSSNGDRVAERGFPVQPTTGKHVYVRPPAKAA